jgi:hypothetical protein
MPRQAMNTLYSLSQDYQRNLPSTDYEIIVVENRSAACLNQGDVEKLGPQFRYFLRDEIGVSPAAAINFGFDQARGDYIGLMIDGARMVSPGILQKVDLAQQMFDAPMLIVPSYDLGEGIQQDSHGYGEKAESSLLQSIEWPQDGYRLFAIAVLGEANERGYMNPIMECTCLFVHRRFWQQIGYADERFQKAGGGALNLHIFRQLGLIKELKLVILPGEGAFHQFHGGVTTNNQGGVDEKEKEFFEELVAYWPGGFSSVRRRPMVLGNIPPASRSHFETSSRSCLRRLRRLPNMGRAHWEDET